MSRDGAILIPNNVRFNSIMALLSNKTAIVTGIDVGARLHLIWESSAYAFSPSIWTWVEYMFEVVR